ncbi:MFS transporter, partial [Clostridium saudiense]|nr:MFS transporter [Clostridium saudiense]
YRDLLNKNLIVVMILIMMFFFSATSYNSSINYYIESILNLPPTFNGVFLSIAGVIGFLANILLTPIIGKKFTKAASFKYITLILALSMMLVGLSKNLALFFLAIILFVAVSSIYVPIQQNIVSTLAKENYGALMGLQNSAKAVGMVIGSLFAGAIFDFGAKLPFMASSIMLFIGFAILMKINIEVE